MKELEGLLADRDVRARVRICLIFACRTYAFRISFVPCQTRITKIEKENSNQRAELIVSASFDLKHPLADTYILSLMLCRISASCSMTWRKLSVTTQKYVRIPAADTQGDGGD